MVSREDLAFVKDPGDLAAKYPKAFPWFNEANREIDDGQVRRRVSRPARPGISRGA